MKIIWDKDFPPAVCAMFFVWLGVVSYRPFLLVAAAVAAAASVMTWVDYLAARRAARQHAPEREQP